MQTDLSLEIPRSNDASLLRICKNLLPWKADYDQINERVPPTWVLKDKFDHNDMSDRMALQVLADTVGNMV